MSNDQSSMSRMTSSVRAIIGAEVLVIDKDKQVRDGMIALLTDLKLNGTCVDDPAEAWPLLGKRFFSVVVVDMDTPNPSSGIESVSSVKLVSPTTSVVVLTPRRSYDDTVAVVRAGALDVVHKNPEAVDYLKDRIRFAAQRSVELRQLQATLREARETHEKFLQRLMAAERKVTDLEDRLAGRDPELVGGELLCLVVARDDSLATSLTAANPPGFRFEAALTGGEALDRCSSSRFHFALVSHDLPDLPQSMVVRSLKAQNDELVAMTFRGPGKGGSVEITDTRKSVPVIADFADAKQLVERLPELSQAFRAKERERRYTQAFRERHYEFVRKFVSLKEKLDEAID